jgi:hypothetical protein
MRAEFAFLAATIVVFGCGDTQEEQIRRKQVDELQGRLRIQLEARTPEHLAFEEEWLKCEVAIGEERSREWSRIFDEHMRRLEANPLGSRDDATDYAMELQDYEKAMSDHKRDICQRVAECWGSPAWWQYEFALAKCLRPGLISEFETNEDVRSRRKFGPALHNDWPGNTSNDPFVEGNIVADPLDQL